MADLTQAQKDALYAEFREQQENDERVRNEKKNLDRFERGGTIVQLDLSSPQPKVDKHTKEPILNEHGQQTFWDAIYFVTLAQLGSEKKYMISLDLGKDLVLGGDYVFTGKNATEKSKEKVTLITKI